MNRRRMTGHRARPAAAVNPLADVAAAWKLEADGADAIGDLDLTVKTSSSSTSFGAAKHNNGWLVTTTSSRFLGRSRVEGVGLLDVQGNPFSFSAWSKITASQLTADCSPGLVQLGGRPASLDLFSWGLCREYVHSGPSMYLRGVTSDGATYTNVDLTGITFNDDAWHFYGFSRSAAGVVRVYFDDQMAEGSGTLTPQALSAATTTYFGLGGLDQQAASSSRGHRGNIDEAYFWTRELTPAEFTHLYNAGTGNYLA